MSTEIETYPNETLWRAAMLKDATRHRNGWQMRTNSKNNLTIEWNNDPRIPTPKRQLTQRELLEEIANDRGVEIT